MNKLLILTLAFAIVPTVALTKEDDDCRDPSRKCHGQVISPEDLFQEAKKHCDESATTPEGWAAIRACIAEAKGKILRERDPRIAKACGKYSGLDRDQCTDWNYIRGGCAIGRIMRTISVLDRCTRENAATLPRRRRPAG